MAGRHCTICQRADRATIDALLSKPGVSLRAIVAQCAGASKDSLARHRAHMIPPVTSMAYHAPAIPPEGTAGDMAGIDMDSPAGVRRIKEERRAAWGRAERDILAQLTPDKLKTMNGRDLAVAGGIATDKFRKWADLERHEPVPLAIPYALQQAFLLAIQVNVSAGEKPPVLVGPTVEADKPCP